MLLTVFRKSRQRETVEVERAQQAQKVCETEHDPAEHTYDRIEEERL
ncbi:DNA-binding protein [Streptomyces sp. NPDC095613]